MAARVADLPDYWTQEFNKHWQLVRADDGNIVVRNHDGTPVEHIFPEGKREVQFTERDLAEFPCATEHAATFARLTIGSRASGSGAGGQVSGTAPVSKPKAQNQPALPKLGLR